MIRAILIAVLLTACGGGGGDNTSPPAPPPEPPTGGTTPPPPAGTIVEAYCDGTTFVEIINDGQGGTYEEKEEKSAQCNFAPVEVSIQGVGTYFKPVTVTVTGDWDGKYETSIGRVSTNAVGIEIYSDGRIGRGNVTIDGQSYPYTIEDDPICENTGVGQKYKTDCLGLEVGGRSAAMIYYGEDDTQVVQIEVGFVRSTSRYPTAVEGTRVPDDHEVRRDVEAFVKYANDFNARSGVYIEFVISDVVWEDSWQSIYDFQGGSRELMEISDIILGWGGSGANHGQAFQATSIYPGMPTQRVVALALGGSALHELGHGMSLGHGVWGDPEWTLETTTPMVINGGVFPRFGHGWSGKIGEGVCGAQGSVMSYSSKAMWSNSLLSCESLGYPPGAWGDAAGNRQQSDEAYALNRIRYSMSLVHNEHLYGQVDPVIPDAPDAPEPEEPDPWEGDKCPRSGTLQTGLVDCQGYAVTNSYPEEGYTYYGEGDTTIVTWEVALLMYKDCPSTTFGPQSLNQGICDESMSQQEIDKAEDIIATMQEILDRGRVYVRLELKHARNAYWTGFTNIPLTDFNVDAVLAIGGSGGNTPDGILCGQGGFGNFNGPLRPWGICGTYSLLHELGHTLGLDHGPTNSINASTGQVFPNFGHGFGSVCPGYGSIMAYNVTGTPMISNSLYPCYEVAPSGYSTKMAGIRGMTPEGDYGYDEAYAINRVRYEVSNINGE